GHRVVIDAHRTPTSECGTEAVKSEHTSFGEIIFSINTPRTLTEGANETSETPSESVCYSVPMQECLPPHDFLMDRRSKGHLKAQEKRIGVPTASALLPDGTIVELVYQCDLPRTLLALYSAGRWTLQPRADVAGVGLVPFSPKNNLIKNNVVMLPSQPRTY